MACHIQYLESINTILSPFSIYDNRTENISEDKVEDIWIPREDKSNLPIDSASESEYSTVEECFQSLRRKNSKPSKSRTQKAVNLDPVNRHSYPLSSTSGNADSPVISSNIISPYACFYGSSTRKVKSGWLDKLCPQGYVFFLFFFKGLLKKKKIQVYPFLNLLGCCSSSPLHHMHTETVLRDFDSIFANAVSLDI